MGKYDKLADEADNAKLFAEMVNSQGKTMKVYELGHASFIWGKDLKHVDDAIKVIEASGLWRIWYASMNIGLNLYAII